MKQKIRQNLYIGSFGILFLVAYAAAVRFLSDADVNGAQALLWKLPDVMGRGWWLMCSGIATAACLTMFLYMVMNQAFSGLLVSRVLLTGGMLCFALVPLNSGWLPWGVLITSVGCLYAAFLIATNWCERQDKWATFRGIFHRRKAHHEHQRTGLGSSD